MTQVTLNLYGAFRQLGIGRLTLEVPEAATVLNLREALEEHLQKKSSVSIPYQLLQASVFASDKAVLNDEDSVDSSSSLSVFPPVCGG